ncbi:MAG: PEP-CTERM sorting domain-containing protein, partial [Verrucomicrobiota bacterium]
MTLVAPAGGLLVNGVSNYEGESFGQGADGLVGGFVFTRLFNQAAPMAGPTLTWIDSNSPGAAAPTGPLVDRDPAVPDPPEGADVSGGVGGLVMIPEPSTSAMLAVGVLCLGIVRRIRK